MAAINSTPAVDVLNQRIASLPINQAELARRVGMDGELLRRSLNGDRKLIGDELVKLCVVLNLNIEDFAHDSNAA